MKTGGARNVLPGNIGKKVEDGADTYGIGEHLIDDFNSFIRSVEIYHSTKKGSSTTWTKE
jgi:hypothetical protein